MNVLGLEDAAADAAGLLRALASEKRLRILCLLSEGERSVGQICAALEVSQANVSQQLAILRRAGLVRGRRDGQTVHYCLASEEGRRLLETLCRVYARRPSAGSPRARRNPNLD
jgi:DNA-binding transcriptional ArsR family regulator